MTVKVAINGFGRMGKLVLRAAFDNPDFEIVHVNEIKGGVECAAHLLEFDTIQGRWDRSISHDGEKILVDGREISFSAEQDPGAVDWAGLGVDMVLECTGVFKTTDLVQPYYQRGVKKVVVAAPVKTEGALNIVYGVNHHLYDGSQDLVTAASCTTNCLAPVVKVLQGNIGIKHGSITTIHDVTNTQVMVDMPHKDLRRARSGLQALIPTTTGSATAITIIYPELKGKLNGHAVRVPTLNGSLTDCVFEMQRAVTVEEVNGLFAAAAEGELNGILGFESRPLVSSDFVGDPRSTIIDGPSTMVVEGTQLKIYAWYDNEWGYVNRLTDVARMVARSL
ncbi:ArsJ-associated glyceraldehyde-3-phosphate dehydrogenase [Aestuariispira insulae]|uniref:Glyceraldehyde-3-phosphate dehydrogenase n=1 Tax=Aestuariispira insulae TaxID=1461337 RepID=A0A3D9HJF8_9PROT|nr:ArsJ-associated glyceraldehyde-3-phosphate dehydrogenase [Aestuariispira insulae]RED49046.1 glyceraldehyde-3-phosphate dehydrogenase (NAD+) [Aestuariispira insulae]